MKKLLMLAAVLGLVVMSSTPVSANEHEGHKCTAECYGISTFQHWYN